MQLNLTETLFVTTDNYQYILKERKLSESGNLYEVVLGYYGTFRQLAKGLVDREIKTSKAQCLKALNERLDELENSIVNQIEITTNLEGK